jgi:hypothetical protein
MEHGCGGSTGVEAALRDRWQILHQHRASDRSRPSERPRDLRPIRETRLCKSRPDVHPSEDRVVRYHEPPTTGGNARYPCSRRYLDPGGCCKYRPTTRVFTTSRVERTSPLQSAAQRGATRAVGTGSPKARLPSIHTASTGLHHTQTPPTEPHQTVFDRQRSARRGEKTVSCLRQNYHIGSRIATVGCKW